MTLRWVRGVLALDAAASEAAEMVHGLRDAALLSWLDDDALSALTVARYATQRTYAAGGSVYARGLFGWEREALGEMQLGPGARVLVGGAGGGRELAALQAMGYAVSGFDPVRPLVEAARAGLSVPVEVGGYAEFVSAVAGHGNPLSALVAGPRYDAMVCGWGSLSHVLSGRGVEAVFAAARRAVRGPLLVSTVLAPPLRGRAARVRALSEAAFRAMGARGVAEGGDGVARSFIPGTGAVARWRLSSLDAMAAGAGWSRRWGREEANVHAVYV